MARVLDAGRDVPRARLQRSVEFERKKREEAEQNAKAAEERATHAQTLKNKALAEKRAATKLAGKLLKRQIDRLSVRSAPNVSSPRRRVNVLRLPKLT